MLNLFKQITSLAVRAGRLGSSFSVALLRQFFQFKKYQDWYYLSPRLNFKAKTKSKLGNWQRKFFFCQADEANALQFVWKEEKIEDDAVDWDFDELEEALMKIGEIDEEYPDDELAELGLSPYDPDAS